MAQLKSVLDRLLSNVSNAYVPEGYASESLFPLINVKEKTGKLGALGSNHLRIEHDLAGGRGKYRFVEPKVYSTSTYTVQSHGLEGLVTEDDYANVYEPFDAEKDEVLGLSTLLWLSKEKALADTLTSTSIMTQNTTLSGTSQWNDYANSDPLDDFLTARLAVREGCGMPPNTAVMDWSVANTLAYSPQILAALGFTANRAGQLSDVELAKAMGVERLIITKAMYNNANEGASDNLDPVWGKHVVFAYLPSAAGKYQVSLGYRIQLIGRGPRRVTKSPVDNPPNSTRIVCDDSYAMHIAQAAAGYLIKSAIA
jgi:hypothetical protein